MGGGVEGLLLLGFVDFFLMLIDDVLVIDGFV